MTKFKMITVLLLLCIFSLSSNAQTRTLTLDEAINIALENNTDIKIALMEIDKANAAVDEAYGYAFPTVDLSANFMHYVEKPVIFFPDFEAMLNNATYGVLFQEELLDYDQSKFKDMGLAEMSMFLANSFETKVQATQILFNSAVFKGIGASEIYLNLSREALKSAASTTIVSVKQAFYGVLLTRQMLEIMNASLKNAEDNLKNVNAYYEQGMVSEYDLLTVKVQIENLRPTISQLENGLKDAKNGLKILLGLEQKEIIDVDGAIEFKEMNVAEENVLISQALDKNYDLNTFSVKQQIDEEFIELDRSEYWPTIAAFGSYSLSGQSDDFDFMNYNTGLVGLSFSMNIFNGTRTNQKVEQSTIASLQTKEQLYQMKDFIKSQVKSKYSELRRVSTQLDAQEQNIILAQKAYNISKVKYSEGTGTQLEIQNAEMALRRAKMNKLQSVYDYIKAYSELEKLIGGIDEKYFSVVYKKVK